MTPAEIKARAQKVIEARKLATQGEWRPFDAGPWGGQGAGLAITDNVDYWPMFDKDTGPIGIANSFFVAAAARECAWLAESLIKAVEAVEDIELEMPLKLRPKLRQALAAVAKEQA